MARPTLSGFNPSVTFAENTVNATPQLLDADVTFTDAEGQFGGAGFLELSGGLSQDRLGIQNQGVSAGQIGVSGTAVTYGGVEIGQLVTSPGYLVVSFNNAATSAAVDALIQALTYQTVSDTPTATRTLALSIRDAQGETLVTSPTFVAAGAGPFAGIDAGQLSAPTFADVDGDGDQDLLIGSAEDGIPEYFRNGAAGAAGARAGRWCQANRYLSPLDEARAGEGVVQLARTLHSAKAAERFCL